MPTYPLQFTVKAPAREQLKIIHRQMPMESPHTYAMQVVHTASQWVLEFTWPRMKLSTAFVVQAWLDSLQGQVGTFRYSPRARAASSLTGRTLAAAAFSYGTNVRLAGWASNAASGLTVGQFFQLGEQLLRITAVPTNADANGQLLIEFQPKLRANHAASTGVNLTNPSGIFRLAVSETPSFDADTDGHPSFPTIVAKEAF